jgi:hypothetical protein
MELADELLRHVAELKERYAELDRLLGGAVGDDAESHPAKAGHDPLRLMALELALDGRTRDEVESYVREAYGVTPDAEMLDSVFRRVGS